MTSQIGPDSINPADFSALTNFVRGYLHQDAADVHGSAVEAARSFRRDAGEGEAAIVHAELKRLLEETGSLSHSELAQLLEELGSAWRFRSRAEIEQVRDALK